MTLSDQLMEHVDTLRSEHEEATETHMRDAYDDGAYQEAKWLRNLGVQVTTPDPEPGDELDEIRERAASRTRWYDDALENAVFSSLEESKGSVYETLARVFDDGFTITPGEAPVKWVSPDGSASFDDRTVASITLDPETYFEWVTAVAIVEARSAGRVSVQLELGEVMGHVWVDPLDEQTTPMAARLHGETYGRDGFPFYPPVAYGGRSRVWPVFEASSTPAARLPSVDTLVGQRERWFINYSRMQNGELPEDDWASEPVVEGEYNLAFIYTQLLPRDPAQYLPTNE